MDHLIGRLETGLNASTSIPPPSGTGETTDLRSAHNQATDQATPLFHPGLVPPTNPSQPGVSLSTTSAAAAAEPQEAHDQDLDRSNTLPPLLEIARPNQLVERPPSHRNQCHSHHNPESYRRPV